MSIEGLRECIRVIELAGPQRTPVYDERLESLMRAVLERELT